MARTSAYTTFLRDPDQASRLEELRAFIGPHADKFLRTYAGEQAAGARGPDGKPARRRHLGFVACAFFLGPCWFFYRKLWLWAWGFVALIVALGFLPGLPPGIGAAIGVALAMSGRSLYLWHAAGRIGALRGDAPIADLDLLRRKGGVSPLAGWACALVMLALAVLVIADLVVTGGSTPK